MGSLHMKLQREQSEESPELNFRCRSSCVDHPEDPKMADLDDFFAKKDKKKKGKKGFSKANTEVLAKNLEENERKEQQAEEKANDVNRVQRLTENAPGINEADGDEWKEYGENKLDYSNLKIDALKLEDEGEQDEEGTELNEDGEKTKKSKEGGPWSKLVASDSVDDSKEDEEESTEPVKEDPPAQAAPAASTATPATKSSYVPPHLRNSSANSAVSAPAATGARPGGPRRMKHAPDINSEVYFPSLSSAMGTDDPNRGQGQANSNRGFEEVKSGSGQSYASRGSSDNAPKLSLDNKFAALRD